MLPSVVSATENRLSLLPSRRPMYLLPALSSPRKRVLSQVNRNRYQHHRRFYQYQQPTEILLPERRCNEEEEREGRKRESVCVCVRVCVCSRMDEGAFFGSTRSNVDFYRVFTAHRRITCPTCAKNIPIRERSHSIYLDENIFSRETLIVRSLARYS